MATDYFFPNVGGVESHVYILSQKLIQLGHKVIIITHDYGTRCGVRHLPAGLKVYYVPLGTVPFSQTQATFPNLFGCLPLIRAILLRERIHIYHAHQALSALALESVMHAKTLHAGIRTVFTDHSLFGLGGGGWGEVSGNKIVKGILSDIESVICVSHTGKENTVLRAMLNPEIVYVIPNAIVADSFQPDEQKPRYDGGQLTIVCVSRLAYRKGIDLLVAAIPRLCAKYRHLRFLIGGSGPKSIELEQMKEKYQSVIKPDQVELLGSIRADQVRDLLVRGDIFLNASLTEAFGMTILEAACTGLLVVSTNVGGIPEILPGGLIEFAEPEVNDLVRATERAIKIIESGCHDPLEVHKRVRGMYSWSNVAKRTENVYLSAMEIEPVLLIERLRRYYGSGSIFGKVMCMVLVCQYIIMGILDWYYPRDQIDFAPDFNYEDYVEVGAFVFFFLKKNNNC
ncbi:phosphatidylinositol glycan, class A [Phakopsora pachyrhizi]|nr:phosphatidylinositol glycan, class A [Phakopsora pachyrhizi]